MLLHEKYEHVTGLDQLLPLSLQIVRFKMMSLRRKAHRRGEHTQVSVDDLPLADRSPDPSAELERKQMRERLAAALQKLGPRCRELYRLKLEGRSYREIQTSMGVGALNTVYTWDFRCRKQLLELLGGSWEAPR